MRNNFDVSMIIVSLNAEMYIVRAIKSLMLQGFSKELFEIIIVDGDSNDRTVALSKSILEKNSVNYQIIKNEKKILSTGWNLGLKAARGKYVIRIDAHSEIQPGYIETGINKIKNNVTLSGVGGVIQTSSTSFIGDRIAAVLSSKIGVGNSLFRIGVKEDTISDTAVYAVYKREIFQLLGFFDESLHRNQDVDFHKKMVSRGHQLMTSPDMRAIYYSRTSVFKFVQQAFNNGFWVINSKGFYARHLAPLVLTLTLTLSLVLSKEYFFILISVYLTIVFIFLLKFKIINTIVETLLTFLLHLFYGVGSFYGIIRRILASFL